MARGTPDPWFDDGLSSRSLRSSYRKYHRRPNSFLSFFSNLSITGWLILINIIAFIIFAILGFNAYVPCEESFCNVVALQPQNFFENLNVWTLLTSMFAHAGFIHLGVNMIVLFSLGSLTEKIIGKKRFLWFYLLGGIFAGLLHVFLSYSLGNGRIGASVLGDPLIHAVGASGAIFAVAGLLMILVPKLKFSILFFPFFALPAYIMIPGFLVVLWIISSVAVYAGKSFLVGNVAHFGGLLAGIAYGMYLRYKYPKKTRMINNLFAN